MSVIDADLHIGKGPFLLPREKKSLCASIGMIYLTVILSFYSSITKFTFWT